MKKISVMGLGYIGLPTSVTFALAGYKVCGFDVNSKVVDMLNSGKIHIVEPGLQEAFTRALESGNLSFTDVPQPADAFIITVQTPFKETPDGKRVSELKYVESAAAMVGKVVAEGNLVVLESTVPPMTTRMVEEIVERESGISRDKFLTAHCPERVIPGKMLKELRDNDRIIGARLPEAAELAKDIYSRVVTNGKINVTDDITAEMCKLVENTYRDINIAYANELSKVCDKLDIDVFRLIELANCHPRVNIHTPGVGVGGHCIAVDPWFIHEKFESETPIIYTARTINDGKPEWVADRLGKEVSPPAVVAVLGLAYKPDIDDLRESPSVILCSELSRRGYKVVVCEPNVKDKEIKGYENLSLEETLKKCDYAVITLAHSQFKEGKHLIGEKKYYDCVGLMRS